MQNTSLKQDVSCDHEYNEPKSFFQAYGLQDMCCHVAYLSSMCPFFFKLQVFKIFVHVLDLWDHYIRENEVYTALR